MVPVSRESRKKLEQLILLEDMVKNCASGKIDIFPEIPQAVIKFIEEFIQGRLMDRVYDIALGDINICKCSPASYGAIKYKV